MPERDKKVAILLNKTKTCLHGWEREMAQLLRALIVLLKDPYSVSSTHMVANNSCASSLGDLIHADMQTLIHMKITFIHL